MTELQLKKAKGSIATADMVSVTWVSPPLGVEDKLFYFDVNTRSGRVCVLRWHAIFYRH